MTVTGLALATGSFAEHTQPLKVGPFVVSMTHHPCGLILPKHSHERASLNVVLRGGYAESIREADVRAKLAALHDASVGSQTVLSFATGTIRAQLGS
jgi:hypothetical protein